MDAFVPLSKLFRPDAPWFIRQREIVAVEPERLWRAATSPEELSQWWCERAEVDLRPGGWFAFRGRHVYGDDLAIPREAFAVLAVEPGERFEFLWPLRGAATRVLVEVQSHIEGSEIVVTQSAGAAPPGAPAEGEHHWWSVALPGLRSYLEAGQAALRPDYPALRAASAHRYRVEVSNYPWLIWRKLTEPGEIRKWFSSGARVELRPGGVFELGPGPGPKRVVAVEPERSLLLDWHEPGAGEGRIGFEIEEGEEASLVTFTDRGPWPSGEDDDARDRRAFRWLGALLHLKQLCERGITPREYQEG